MLPENEILGKVLLALTGYISDRYYTIIIFVLIFLWARHLYNEFHQRSMQYNEKSPKYAFFLNLQCRRWERYVHQVMVEVKISVVVAFIMYLFIEMWKDIESTSGSNNMISPQEMNIAYAETLIFVLLFSMMIRTLWDARGVYSDFRKCEL
uniref:Uncharacterized protein n=1 Tax=Candidatus Kentrum sp. LPFa TaxID=2126335 RepID=A0A450WSH8_9GAMM|nr:MAG: hypothetical protein BECKLPF1236B_GA0070989_11936 [Candidatus Kentron sp. LPFa]